MEGAPAGAPVMALAMAIDSNTDFGFAYVLDVPMVSLVAPA
jgi:hypothetical protein